MIQEGRRDVGRGVRGGEGDEVIFGWVEVVVVVVTF